jgi:sulfide:quinone oxidoreductase
MAKVVVLGAGISGHTAALNLKRKLKKRGEVIVVSPNSSYQWVPSNVWVGTGHMKPDQVYFSLSPVYEKMGIEFKQAKAISIHPEGDGNGKPYVTIQYTSPTRVGEVEKVYYDFLINATGPKLNFKATPGLGPDYHTYSICTYSHAEEAWNGLKRVIEKLKKGKRQKIVIGLGHGSCTCQGAALEYTLNVASLLKELKLDHLADIRYITNEFFIGDLGMGGAYVKNSGYISHTKNIISSLFYEYGVKWHDKASVYKVEDGLIFYESYEGEEKKLEFDYAMLLPPFQGVGIKGVGPNGEDYTDRLFKSNGFMIVDADYDSAKKPYHLWSGKDWPRKLQNPTYPNIFAIGIAFAPPHPISKPHTTKSGRPLTPAPPRTGMPSAVMGHATAMNISEWILEGKPSFQHRASMAEIASICVVSIGYGLRGVAGSMSVYPTVPDFEKYPDFGRDINYTIGEVGIAGHWFKWLMHHLFLYKAQAKPGWWLIPD